MKPKLKFSQRHPLLFGFLLIIMAMVLFLGAMAFLRMLNLAPNGSTSGKAIGVVHVEGMILDSTEVVDWITTLQNDDNIAGVLLRVNSPGGSIAPSQELYQAVRRLADNKPVVASFSAVAASGGYYAAAPCTSIVSNPGSLTASIGVLMEYLNFEDLLSEYGIKQVLLASGTNKGAGSPFKDMTPAQREQIMSVIMDMHDQFVSDVASARDLDIDHVRRIADGSALSGRQALEVGLVDMLGGEQVAMDLLVEICGMEGEPEIVEGPLEEKPLLHGLVGKIGIDFEGLQTPAFRFTFQ